MGRYSLHDGKFKAEKISITGKIMVNDRFENVLASSNIVVASVVQATGTTLTIALQPDVPRAIKIANAPQAQLASTRRFKVVGYDAKGNYVTEIMTAPVGTTGTITSNNAFAHIGSVTPIDDRVITNYGTFGIVLTDKLGLAHPLKHKLDIKGITRYNLVASGFGNPIAQLTGSLLGSATNRFINLTYDTIHTGLAADNLTGSAMIVRYLTEFQ